MICRASLSFGDTFPWSRPDWVVGAGLLLVYSRNGWNPKGGGALSCSHVYLAKSSEDRGEEIRRKELKILVINFITARVAGASR